MSFHPGQMRILQRARRFNTVACGRRFGKTSLGMVLTSIGWPGHHKGVVQGFDVGWFAPTFQIMDEAWRTAKRVYAAQGMVLRTDSSLHRMELSSGGAMDFWSLESGDSVGLGRRYGMVILDEAAKARHLAASWQEAIRPTLTDFQGGAWFLSTPKGRNFFWALTQLPGSDQEWQHHHAPTTANPHMDPAEIESARRNLPERIFAQEYLAQFLEDGGGVFRRVTAAVDTALATDPGSRDVGDGRAYVIGVDWGRHQDFTVFVVLDARDKAVVALDRCTQIEYSLQLARLRALRTRYPHAALVAEANSIGGPLVEQLRRDGVNVSAFQTTHASKGQIIESLAVAFEQGELRIPAIQWLIDELLAFDQERTASGMMRYSAPAGSHDDGVMALAIAWHAQSSSPGRVASAGARSSWGLR